MLKLDHVVIHIDSDMARLEALQQQIAPLGYPFAPRRGKGTGGFKAANLWIGEQYYEMVWLKRPDGGGWRTDWVYRYNQGQRGIICLMLLTDQLDRMHHQFQERGLSIDPPERIRFSFLGLFRKSMPWRNMYLGPIPQTDLYIGFQEMDNAQALQSMQHFMIPNASKNGILGICSANVQHAFTDEAWRFLQTAFPQPPLEEQRLFVPLDANQDLAFTRINIPEQRVHVQLQAVTSRPECENQSFSVENVELQTIRERNDISLLDNSGELTRGGESI